MKRSKGLKGRGKRKVALFFPLSKEIALNSFQYFIGAQALRANMHSLSVSLNNNPHSLHICFPCAFGAVIGVAYPIADAFGFSTNFTLGHGCYIPP